MLIGLIADTHDHLTQLGRAVQVLNEHKVGFVLHAGDFIAPFALRPLEGLQCPWIGVFGNNDGERPGLTKVSLGRIQTDPFELNLDGRKVVLVHDLGQFDRQLFIDRGAWLVCSGHTHQAGTSHEGGAQFVNPGEVCGWLYGKSTLALIDTRSGEVRIQEF